MHFPYYLVIKQKEGVIKPLKSRERLERKKKRKDNPFADMFFR